MSALSWFPSLEHPITRSRKNTGITVSVTLGVDLAYRIRTLRAWPTKAAGWSGPAPGPPCPQRLGPGRGLVKRRGAKVVLVPTTQSADVRYSKHTENDRIDSAVMA